MAQVTASIQLGFDGKPAFESKLKSFKNADGTVSERLIDYINYATMTDPQAKMTRAVSGMRPDDREGADPHSYVGDNIRAIWAVVGPAYADFKNNTVRELTGTPIDSWAEFNQLEGASHLLKSVGITTLEQFRDCPDVLLNRIAIPDRLGWRAKAGRYLDRSQKAEAVATNETTRNEVAELRDQVQLLMGKLAELTVAAETRPSDPGREKLSLPQNKKAA